MFSEKMNYKQLCHFDCHKAHAMAADYQDHTKKGIGKWANLKYYNTSCISHVLAWIKYLFSDWFDVLFSVDLPAVWEPGG